ncbi:MAG TPA: GNAT family N-acetyltransferase [Caulobacteraceae bacterium]
MLRRDAPGGGRDAMGSYPLAALSRDADLAGGLRRLTAHGLISVVLVADPLAGPSPQALAEVFPVCRAFKTHLLIDLAKGPYEPTKHHRDRIRRSLRRCGVERGRLSDRLEEWKALYAGLVRLRGVTGVAAFPDPYFDVLAEEPRLEAFSAVAEGEVVAMTLWFAHGGVVYNHLTASNDRGYAAGASFALYDAAIEHFRGSGVMNLGGGAGATDDPDDGLAAFKRGFANSSATALLCGAALDEATYAARSAGKAGDFFPAYRG